MFRFMHAGADQVTVSDEDSGVPLAEVLAAPDTLERVVLEVASLGRLIVIGLMFWGRLGAVTIVLVLLRRGPRESLVQYPEETVLVG